MLRWPYCWRSPLAAPGRKAVPNAGERVESLITFGAQLDTKWGDDDFSQTFFLIPEKQRTPVYIRMFNPDCGGKNDDLKGPAWVATTLRSA